MLRSGLVRLWVVLWIACFDGMVNVFFWAITLYMNDGFGGILLVIVKEVALIEWGQVNLLLFFYWVVQCGL